LETGYAVAPDLAEHLMLTVGIDYRTASGSLAQRGTAAAAGIRGVA